jgi:hypothetical protein
MQWQGLGFGTRLSNWFQLLYSAWIDGTASSAQRVTRDPQARVKKLATEKDDTLVDSVDFDVFPQQQMQLMQ